MNRVLNRCHEALGCSCNALIRYLCLSDLSFIRIAMEREKDRNRIRDPTQQQHQQQHEGGGEEMTVDDEYRGWEEHGEDNQEL